MNITTEENTALLKVESVMTNLGDTKVPVLFGICIMLLVCLLRRVVDTNERIKAAEANHGS